MKTTYYEKGLILTFLFFMTKHSKSLSDGEFLKTIMLKTAPSLFQDFKNTEKNIQIIEEL